MATNVFGKPLTDGNRMQRALEALNNPNADGKRDQALAYVTQLKGSDDVSTLGIFYNATGETMVLTQQHSWFGNVHDSYPTKVQNGQWGAFYHVKTTGATSPGSVGFVVYRVLINDTEFCQQLISWSTPGQVGIKNHVYCDIFEIGQIDAPNEVYEKMGVADSQQHVVKKFGMLTTSKIDPEGTSPLYEVEFTREDVAPK